MPAHVAIVILNYNGRHYLQKFLPFVLAATYSNISIWVIDNASTDDSVAFLQSTFPAVKIICNQSNLGFAEGYNTGLAQVPAEYFVLLNSDAEVTTGFIEPIIARMEADEKIAFAQPKLLDLQQRNRFEYAGAAGGWLDAVGYPFCRGRVLETVELDTKQYDETTEVFWASGCCLFVRASVFRKLGGFYKFLFMQNEDIELCWRAQNEGYKIVACSQSTIYHKGGGSLDWANAQKVFYTFRNNLIMITRNMPWQRLCWVLPVRFAIDGAATVQYLLKKNPKAAKAVLAGQWAYLKWLLSDSPAKWSKHRGFNGCSGILHKVLVWQYFFRRQKSFEALFYAKSQVDTKR